MQGNSFSVCICEEITNYLLLGEGGLDHGSLEAVHPLQLALLPQGLEHLH